MDIREIIQKDIPDFTGICVQESYIPLEIIREFGVSLAWSFKRERAKEYKQILVAGNKKHKGYYFIADIKEIISVREAYTSKKLVLDMVYDKDELIRIQRGLRSKVDKTNNPIDKRSVVFFEKPKEIRSFTESFTFTQSSFYYIHATYTGTPHLKSLKIKGFKEKEREVSISFCERNKEREGSVTIIHGENGSGKTTFLKVIQAILAKDFDFLRKENVQSFELIFQKGEKEINLSFDMNDIENSKNEYEMENQTLQNVDSIFFGINRGVIETTQSFVEHIQHQLLKMSNLAAPPQGKAAEILGQLLKEIPEKMSLPDEEQNIGTNHKVIDNLSIELIEKTLRKAFDKGKNAIIKGMNNAFLNAMDSFLTGIGDEDIQIPEDFEVRFKAKKSFFQSFIKDLENSKSKDKLKAFVDSDNFQSIHKENDLFKSLIINMLKQAESDEKNDIELKAIYRVIDTFNDFLVRSKKMVLDAVEANILFPNGSKHKLSELSSGERHLLCFLTVFLIMERNSNIFLIDEPEVSLSMSWQRKLLPLLSEFAPQAQIIVATHSPEIVNEHDEYLRELN